MRASAMVVLALTLTLSGCQTWSMLSRSETNPMAGKTSLLLLPLAWERAQVDGMPQQEYISRGDTGERQDWAVGKAAASRAFRATAIPTANLLKLVDVADPNGSTVILAPYVIDVATGGLRPTKLTIGVNVLALDGTPIEALSTRTEVKNRSALSSHYAGFQTRISEAAAAAGSNVAGYVRDRLGVSGAR